MDEEYDCLKIVIVGDGGIGKTCLFIRYRTGEFPTEYVPTIADGCTLDREFILNDNVSVISLDFWDTAAAQEFDRLRSLAYRYTDIFLICFSIIDQNSLSNISLKWIKEIDLQIAANKMATNSLKILVGLKSDLRNKWYNASLLVYGYINKLKLNLNILIDVMNIIILYQNTNNYNNNNKPIPFNEINKIKNECNITQYMEASALNGDNVDELFDVSVKMHLNRLIQNKSVGSGRLDCIKTCEIL